MTPWLLGSCLIALPILGCAAIKGRSGSNAPAPAAASAAPTGPAAVAAKLTEVARASLRTLTATKWRLGNGLEIVLLPDPAATSISYTTWFRVGSRNENEGAGETGLAHLFEHLMFTQTKNAPADAFDRALEEAGGSANAMTFYDYTAYLDELPPDELAVAVKMEADRMVNLDLRKRQVENERDVVVEERLSAVEDSVDGVLDEIMYKQAFRTHPYRWPIIGWMKDIKAVTREKAAAFYRRFYAPNNAVIVLTGRFDPATALELLAAAYGPLSPSEDLPKDDAKPERAPAQPVEASVVRPVPAEKLVTGFPAPGLGAPDRAAYEVMDEILAGGPSSRLYKTLVVDKEWASSVNGDVAPTRDPGLYAIWVQMTKGHTAAEAERVIAEAAADLASRPVSQADLSKAIARLETAFWEKLASSHGRAEALGQFEIATGDFRQLFERAGQYTRVTAEDVRKVAADYLAPGARSLVVAKPKAPEAS